MAGIGSPIKDIRGQKFGRLTAIHVSKVIYGRGAMWKCICECGSQTDVNGSILRSGRQQSCGCLRSERARETRTTHGHATAGNHSRLYVLWCGIKARCENRNHKSYLQYGGRGITLCDAWQSFPAFLADMGEPPNERSTVERSDNNKGYEPSNCRWASRAEQSQNRRANIQLTAHGRSFTSSELALMLGLKVDRLRRRLKQGQRLFSGIEVGVTYPSIINQPSNK